MIGAIWRHFQNENCTKTDAKNKTVVAKLVKTKMDFMLHLPISVRGPHELLEHVHLCAGMGWFIMKSVFKSWFLENICLKIPASVFRMWVYHEGLFGGKHRQNVWKHHSNPERWAWDCRSEQYDIKHSWHSCWSREAFFPLKKKSWKNSMNISWIQENGVFYK